MAKEKLQPKVKALYDALRNDFYLCREYGGGKTTSAEYLNSMFNGLPLDLVKRVAIRGNPQLTEEKMIGRPHYGKMHQGQEDVVWQHFVLVGPKIFDEF